MKESLIKNTSAYISLIKDIKNDRLNHAYLLLSSDRLTRGKVFASRHNGHYVPFARLRLLCRLQED